ncbi:MAG: 2-oxo acid dehydrogenase subunit E2 [Candidatus Marinimicrobia bacterium]|nr:2-oxo acid dehydrogenase subunit E2 [Candidatus Neomarinimicrobiota bacterium]MCF7829326.1 2-oxo acid dehydrogenase subunit E2 [Candidatus Neomarinimicrobiota bacterium]MCF7880012.1 2-oxo acid dehydrogenase subunit E2 [Candidatus Neomarinimicrobiota bacterium]
MASNDHMTPWRKVSTAVYTPPSDARIYGTVEADVTEVTEYITAQRKQGNKLTMTHFVAAAIARTIYEDIPGINCFIRRGKVVMRDDAEVFVSVALERGKDMTGVLVPKTQVLSVSEIAEYLYEEVQKKRSGEDTGAESFKSTLAKIPWPFRRPVFLFVKWWMYDLGFKLPFLDAPRDPFGSVLLSNIGTHGLSTGMAALFPIGKVPAVLVMGKVTKKPVVIRDKVVIRSMMPLTATMDHRVMDGAQAGALARGIKRRLRHPETLDQPASFEEY